MPGFLQGIQPIKGAGFDENIPGCVPGALLHLGEIPGMAFPVREVTAGLIDGQIIFRAGQVNGCDQAVWMHLRKHQLSASPVVGFS